MVEEDLHDRVLVAGEEPGASLGKVLFKMKFAWFRSPDGGLKPIHGVVMRKYNGLTDRVRETE